MVRDRRLIAIAAAVVVLCAGCAQQQRAVTTSGGVDTVSSDTATGSRTTAQPPFHVHAHAVQPVAGASAGHKAPPSGTAAGVSVSGQDVSLARPMSAAQVRKQLAESGMSANPNQATLAADGLAVAPPGAPPAVQEMINAGNQIALLPYRWAGGHLTYQDTAYDCSGSLSYVLGAAHLLDHTVDSTELESYGDPGPGKWVTIFANAGHTFMYVGGLRFDTVALAETGSRWSDRPADEPDFKTFVVRHPPGL